MYDRTYDIQGASEKTQDARLMIDDARRKIHDPNGRKEKNDFT